MKNSSTNNYAIIIVALLIGAAIGYFIPSVFSPSTPENNCTVNDYESSSHKIEIDNSKALYDNFQKTRSGQFKNPTEYLWISLDDLKCYISFLEDVEKQNTSQPNISGIAMFFGRYGAKNLDSQIENNKRVPRFGDYNERATLFFNPTFKDNNTSATQEIFNHKPFSITPDDPDSDKYKGTFIELDYARSNGFIKGNTTLNYDELNAIPPKM